MKALMAVVATALVLASTAAGGGKLQSGSLQLYQLNFATVTYGATSTSFTFTVQRIKRQPNFGYPVQLALNCGVPSTLIKADQASVSSAPVTMAATVPLSIPGAGCLAWVYTLNGDPEQNPYYAESNYVGVAIR